MKRKENLNKIYMKILKEGLTFQDAEKVINRFLIKEKEIENEKKL